MYLLGLLLLPLPVLASPLVQDVTAIKSWLVTCLIVILLGGLVLLLARKKLLPSRRTGREMQVQSVLSLGVKEKLVLVQVEDRRFLLGVTPQQISMLAALDRADTDPAPASFAQLLQAADSSPAEAGGKQDQGVSA